jgi:F-box interacting protein
MPDYIPTELIQNILSRLPVDDVLRCTSVCKSWYLLIASPSFASSHLNLSSPNQEARLLVHYCKPEDDTFFYCLHRHTQTFDVIAKLDHPHHQKSGKSNSYWKLIDSLNGLVCLYDHEDTIALWNPSLRKSLILPKTRVLSSEGLRQKVGVGFLPTSNECKVVWVSYSFETSQNEAKIYELSSGSWRDLKLGDFSNGNYCLCNGQQAHYNGILHWHASFRKKDKSGFAFFIFSFDTKDEKFGAMMLPSCIRHNDSLPFQPSIFRESLCLIESTDDKYYNVWVMKEYGVAESWQKIFCIDDEHGITAGFPILRCNGEILFMKAGITYGLVSYDRNNNQVKSLGLVASQDLYFKASTYMVSLVLMNGPK